MTAMNARKANLLKLIEQHGTLEKLAELTGSSPRHLSQMKNGTRNMGHKVARRIEAKLTLPAGWLDMKHSKSEANFQGVLGAEELLKDFEMLPPLLQDEVSKKARELRQLIEGVKPEYRNAISAPPSEPTRYAEWEGSIKALWSMTNGTPRPEHRATEKKK